MAGTRLFIPLPRRIWDFRNRKKGPALRAAQQAGEAGPRVRPSAQASDSVSVEGRTTPSVDIAEVRGCLPVSLKDAPVHPTSGSLGEMPEETGLTLGSWEGIGQDRTLWRVVLPCVPLPCSCA